MRTPRRTGKWGAEDQLGSLNYLDAAEVLRGAQHIRAGDVFTLQIQMGRTKSPLDEVSKTATGKLLRRELRART